MKSADFAKSGSLFQSFPKAPSSLPVELGGGQGKEFQLDRRSKRFVSTEPVWVRYIAFVSGDCKKFKSSITFKYRNLKGDEKYKNLSVSDNGVNLYVYINDIVTSFEIKSGAKLFRPDLSKVSVSGFDLDELARVSENVIKAFELKVEVDNRLQDNEAEIAEIQGRVDSLEKRDLELVERVEILKKDLGRFEDSIGAAQSELDRISSERDIAQAQLDALNVKETNAQNNVDQLKEVAGALNRQIAQERNELEKLTSDRSLISDEYRDYVKEGRSQSFWYLLFSVLPALVIILAVQQVYDLAQLQWTPR